MMQILTIIWKRLKERLKALHRAKVFQALDALEQEARDKGLDRLSDAEIDAEIKTLRRKQHR